MKRQKSTVLLVLCMIGAHAMAGNDSFTIDWYGINTGGGNILGPAWSLDGTVGHPLAAKPVGDAQFQLIPGFVAPFLLEQAAFPPSLFHGIGTLSGSGTQSGLFGISGDGKVAVGFSLDAGSEQPVYWSQPTGIVGLGQLPGGPDAGQAFAASFNGSLVAGQSFDDIPQGAAVVWTKATGLVSLVPPGATPSEGEYPTSVFGVSADSSVLAGTAFFNGQYLGFHYSHETGFTPLGDIPGGGVSTTGRALSADGSTVAATSLGSNGTVACRWTMHDGLVSLGDIAGGSTHKNAYGISADGSAIVGSVLTNGTEQAYRWREETGMVALGSLAGPQHYETRAYDVSGNGSTVVGWAVGVDNSDQVAFIWNPRDGMRSIQDVLESDFGLDLGGWTLERARAVSDDGCVVAGEGLNPDNKPEGWIARLVLQTIGNQDGDCDVDLQDFKKVLDCFSGPDMGIPIGCEQADTDGDGYVGLSDFAALANSYTGG